MGEAVATMEEHLAATMVSLNESRARLASCARRLGVKEQGRQVATTPSLATTTTPMFVQGQVADKPVTSASSPSLISKHRARSVGALYEDVVLAPAMPTRCSTFVLANPQEGCVAGAHVVNTDQPCLNSFPRFDGTNPGLWREKCLEYFTKFSICKPLWTIASRMHMDGKAKEWFDAYILRQVVDDWSEFMDAVESKFGSGDFCQELQVELLPSEISGVFAASPVFDGIQNRSVSMTGEAYAVHMMSHDRHEWIAEHAVDNAPHDTYGQQVMRSEASLQGVIQRPEPTSVSYEEVLTHVGSVTLFLEPCVKHAEVVFSEPDRMEFEDDMLTVVGGLSLFLELSGSADGILMPSILKDVMCNEEPPEEYEHEHAYMQQLLWGDASLGDIAHTVEPLTKGYSYDVLTHFGSSSLLLEHVASATDKLCDAVLPEDVSRSDEAASAYNRNTFDPGILTVSVEGCVLELSPPLQCHGFITGSTIDKSEHLLDGSLRDSVPVPSDPRVGHLILWDTSIWKVTYSATHQWDPGISRSLQLFDSDALRSSRCQPMLLLECNQQEMLDWQILHLITGSSALSKVEFICLHTLESQVILLADKWTLQSELFAASVRFHVISIQKLNTIVMSCTCPFSRWSRHQGDTVMAVLRRDAFRGRASEGAEYSIKLDTQSPILGIQEFCSVATLASKLQYMTWDPGIHSSVWALEVTAADTSDNASFLPVSHCRISSYIVWRLQHGHAVAWGQATFCRAVV